MAAFLQRERSMQGPSFAECLAMAKQTSWQVARCAQEGQNADVRLSQGHSGNHTLPAPFNLPDSWPSSHPKADSTISRNHPEETSERGERCVC